MPLDHEGPRSAVAAELRDARAALFADGAIRGRAVGAALATIVDAALEQAFLTVETRSRVAVVALGSYARRELCPGSDIDVLLVHSMRGRRNAQAVQEVASRLWYPLWDAGFVTGHGARTVKESLALAGDELDALTSFLDLRLVAGDEELASALQDGARALMRRRRDTVLRALADAAARRRVRPGPVAEMLEPDLKEGAGGLRDIQALDWAGWAFGEPGGVGALVAEGHLAPGDVARLGPARARLLDARVELHRATRGRSDQLTLQDQDAVAVQLGYDDTDTFARELASAAREVAWIVREVWTEIHDAVGGGPDVTDEVVADGVVVRRGRVHVRADEAGLVPSLRVLEAAACAAERDIPFDRASLAQLRAVDPPSWDVWERAAFLRLLRQGERAVAVFEALDHEGVLDRFLPEWSHVRSLPQRNAYHRFTVDRHLLEAVAECARLLDAGERSDGSAGDTDAVVARACRRPELLLLGALLHDIAKGRPGDHSSVGAGLADAVARRMGLDSEGREVVVWLVRNHLLMADVATRRDLSDAAVADAIAQECAGDAERLRLLYLLTIGDSLATGPAAWSPAKAALVRDLFVKTAAAIERGEARSLAADRRDELVARIGADRAGALLGRLPDAYVLAFGPAEMAVHEDLLRSAPVVRFAHDDDQVFVTVVAPDRPRLLATIAGALTVSGLHVLEANLFSTSDGFAIDVFRIGDPFGRARADEDAVARTVDAALSGEMDLDRRVEDRRRAYATGRPPGPVSIELDVDASSSDTVVEVHADDEVGLLFRLASVFADLGLDVRLAKVATLGSRVVDVFYVRAAPGGGPGGGAWLDELARALAARIAE